MEQAIKNQKLENLIKDHKVLKVKIIRIFIKIIIVLIITATEQWDIIKV